MWRKVKGSKLICLYRNPMSEYSSFCKRFTSFQPLNLNDHHSKLKYNLSNFVRNFIEVNKDGTEDTIHLSNK